MSTCAFVSCVEAGSCCLVGGCRRHPPKRYPSPTDTTSTVEYNPMMGTRLDLMVYADATPAEAERTRLKWLNARIAYLRSLLAGELSRAARDCYQRELDALVDNKKAKH